MTSKKGRYDLVDEVLTCQVRTQKERRLGLLYVVVYVCGAQRVVQETSDSWREVGDEENDLRGNAAVCNVAG